MTALTPTPEQSAIVDAFATGSDLVIEAGAGTGKTSTLRMLAAHTGGRGVYVAYNRSIADDAARGFPTSVLCKTAHSLAYAAVGRDYAHRLRAPRMPARQTAIALGINDPLRLADDRAPLAPQQLARIVMSTVDRFCYSADPEPDLRHVPIVIGLEEPLVHAQLAAAVVPLARRAWSDLTDRGGQLRFTHDCYLKLWQLSRPQLGADFVLLDEAQDANPAVAAIVEGQQAQRILVGDQCQAIYGWRGAVDAMRTFTGHRLALSQSFRFGPAIAVEANKWLSLLGARLRLRGFEPVASRVGPAVAPAAVLCRSNAGAFRRVMDAVDAGRRAALVGGGGDIKRMAEAALRLQAGQPCDHPELLAFASWQEVRDYVEQDQAGGDLKVFVDLVDKQGADAIIRIADRLVDEHRADLVVSTAHKAKGREWSSVHVATDFREPKPRDDGSDGEIPREDAMLAYVTVTRAKLELDREGLEWVDRWVYPKPAPLWAEDPVRARRRAREDEARLTGVPEEQADWDRDGWCQACRDGRHDVCTAALETCGCGCEPRQVAAAAPAELHELVSTGYAPRLADPHLTFAEPAPARAAACPRCGSAACICGGAEKAAWLASTGRRAGP